MSRNNSQHGGALLAVLWLAAALSTIAFSIANTVRGETERATTAVENTKAQFLARGAMERYLYQRAVGFPPLARMGPFIRYQFPAGEAVVEVIPESSKLNINQAPPAEILALLLGLGVPGDLAQQITLAILDWRASSPTGGFSPFDQYYLSRSPSFLARHSSLEEVEELLLVRGMTPEIFYGGFQDQADGSAVLRAGLRDCVTVFGGSASYDINTVHPAVMLSAGIRPARVQQITALRRVAPFLDQSQLLPLQLAGEPGLQRLALNPAGNTFTLRATARLYLGEGPSRRLSETRTTTAALIRWQPKQGNAPYHILRWYERALSELPWPGEAMQ
jgi:general secretion pathway protein K